MAGQTSRKSAKVTKKVTKKSVKRAAAKKGTKKVGATAASKSPSKLIDARIKGLPAWQGTVLAQVRRLIKQAEPDVVEELKWAKPSNSMTGVPVWEHDGIICTGETYKDKVKLTFAKGASIQDPARLFNSSLDGNMRRAIDIHEGERLDEQAFKNLVRAAAALNASKARR